MEGGTFVVILDALPEFVGILIVIDDCTSRSSTITKANAIM